MDLIGLKIFDFTNETATNSRSDMVPDHQGVQNPEVLNHQTLLQDASHYEDHIILGSGIHLKYVSMYFPVLLGREHPIFYLWHVLY